MIVKFLFPASQQFHSEIEFWITFDYQAASAKSTSLKIKCLTIERNMT